MNERIKELAEQAHEFAVSKYEKRLETEKSSNVFFYKIKDKQFAELIVRECVDIVSGTAVNTPPNDLFYGYNLGVNKAAENIKERFGIEE